MRATLPKQGITEDATGVMFEPAEERHSFRKVKSFVRSAGASVSFILPPSALKIAPVNLAVCSMRTMPRLQQHQMPMLCDSGELAFLPPSIACLRLWLAVLTSRCIASLPYPKVLPMLRSDLVQRTPRVSRFSETALHKVSK